MANFPLPCHPRYDYIPDMAEVTNIDLGRGIESLRLGGALICLHSSLRSFGHVAGGAETVVAAFLAAGCTLMVPAHCDDRRVPPPAGRNLARNGTSPARQQDPDEQAQTLRERPPVDPLAIDRGMGAIAHAVVHHPASARGCHPALSFAAVGPRARELIAAQSLLDDLGPIRQLAGLGGALLLAGVDLRSLTALHLSERMAGRVPFRRWARQDDGAMVEFTCGGCSNGFERLAPVLADLAHYAMVGASSWRCYPAAPLLERAAHTIRAQASITHCGNDSCERCRDAVLGGPDLAAIQDSS